MNVTTVINDELLDAREIPGETLHFLQVLQ